MGSQDGPQSSGWCLCAPIFHPSSGKVGLCCGEVGGACRPRRVTRLLTAVSPLCSNKVFFTFSLGTLVAGHTIKIQLDLYPFKAGLRQLQVLISSNEVKEIKGYKDVFVAAARPS